MFDDRISKMKEDSTGFLTSALNEKRTYTVEEIQNILGIGRNAAYNLIKVKAFHSVKVGGNIRISRKSFDAWLDGEGVQADE